MVILESLEKEMAFRGFIDWQCPAELKAILPEISFGYALCIAMDIECGLSFQEIMNLDQWESEEEN